MQSASQWTRLLQLIRIGNILIPRAAILDKANRATYDVQARADECETDAGHGYGLHINRNLLCREAHRGTTGIGLAGALKNCSSVYGVSEPD